MVSVDLEMKPFSGQVDLEKAAVLIIDMQVCMEECNFCVCAARRRISLDYDLPTTCVCVCVCFILD